jgi:hypothetical protein
LEKLSVFGAWIGCLDYSVIRVAFQLITPKFLRLDLETANLTETIAARSVKAHHAA